MARWMMLVGLAAVTIACSGGSEATDAGSLDASVVNCPNNLPGMCPSPAPDYATVMSVFQDKCVPCHQPGGVGAPRYFQSYAEIYAQRQTVLDQVYSCTMPPQDAGQLTSTERSEILAWMVCNAPM